jgi:hypothetical protein
MNESLSLYGEGEEKPVRDIGKSLQLPVIRKSLIERDINHGINDINYPKGQSTIDFRSARGIDGNSIPILDDSDYYHYSHIYRDSR